MSLADQVMLRAETVRSLALEVPPSMHTSRLKALEVSPRRRTSRGTSDEPSVTNRTERTNAALERSRISSTVADGEPISSGAGAPRALRIAQFEDRLLRAFGDVVVDQADGHALRLSVTRCPTAHAAS